MVTNNRNYYAELESLANKIENNTANLADYRRYEQLLANAGLPRTYIFSYVKRAGFSSWEEFIKARILQEKVHQENQKAKAVGGLVGIGLGLLLASALSKN
jgi:hypothetical protein